LFLGKNYRKKRDTNAYYEYHHEEKKNAPKLLRRGREGEGRRGEERDFRFVVGFARE
jgi:hypothetical protein